MPVYGAEAYDIQRNSKDVLTVTSLENSVRLQ
jgi:hypothetical protein